MTEHLVAWTIESEDVCGTFTCTAAEGAECRVWCNAGCEEYCTDPDEHPQTDQGMCGMLVWFTDSGERAEFHYSGDHAPLRDGPIEFVWEGEDYSWKYVEVVADARQAGGGSADAAALWDVAGHLAAL